MEEGERKKRDKGKMMLNREGKRRYVFLRKRKFCILRLRGEFDSLKMSNLLDYYIIIILVRLLYHYYIYYYYYLHRLATLANSFGNLIFQCQFSGLCLKISYRSLEES